MSIKTTKLRNGSTVPEGLVTAVCLTISGLMGGGFPGWLTIYELKEKAADPGYVFSSPSFLRQLQDLALVREDGSLASYVGDIVSSAIDWPGESMTPSFRDTRSPNSSSP